MRQRLLAFAVLLACAGALGATQTVTIIELAPSGRILAEDSPTLRGDLYYFHRISDGTLMTLRKADVKSISDEVLGPSWTRGVTEIADLPMEGGGSSQAGPKNARNAGRAPSAVGATNAMPNDYVVGRTWAAPPPNAFQSSPGAPPQAAPPR
jgi:hypothetical protein